MTFLPSVALPVSHRDIHLPYLKKLSQKPGRFDRVDHLSGGSLRQHCYERRSSRSSTTYQECWDFWNVVVYWNVVTFLVSFTSHMAFSFSTATSTWSQRMCACGYGHCLVKSCACSMCSHMASSFFIAMSTWPQRMCACGYGHCLVKVSKSHKNPGHAYYVCPQPVQCGNWIGWCDESGTRIPDHDSGSTNVMQLRADVVNIFNTLRVMKTTNKLAYKFKTKPLEHEDLMCEVFTNAIATGKHHWTPGEKVVDVGEGESDSVDSPRLAPFTEPYRLVVNSLPNSLTVQLDEADPGTKRKKKRHGTGASQKYGIEPCMQRLMAIPNFISTPLYHFACTVLENADYREILMCMPDDENVVGWFAALQVSKGLSHQRIMWKGQSNNYRNYDDVIIELAEEEEDLQKKRNR
ncbi:hypothetical protein TEA_022202 [Camellia sinensis var. sinensis]|uniref:GRF-type domain-containing protein n=1 Tax=Camellia sinensis var. sinensis TaxID=542762 RepID=A0A4S4EDC5_CAMSN|nr:hypothetical protein TEA_022202 [Camellia sinensis var. sinensis]